MKSTTILGYDRQVSMALPDGVSVLHSGTWEEKEIPRGYREVAVVAYRRGETLCHRGYSLPSPLDEWVKRKSLVAAARLNFSLDSSREALLAVADDKAFARPLVFSYGFTPSEHMTFTRYISSGPSEDSMELLLAVPEELAEILAKTPALWLRTPLF